MTKYAGPKRNDNKEFTDSLKALFPHIAQGKSNREIAEALDIRLSLVYQRIDRIMDITGCINRDEVIAFCKQEMEVTSSDAS